MYVANSGNNTIVEFSPSGQNLGVFASTNLVEPYGLAFNAAGNLYVANFGPGDPPFAIFSPTGQYLGTLSQRFSDAAGVAFDASGNLYVANSLGFFISVISPTGQSLPSFGSVTNPVIDPTGLAFDSSGNLYASTAGNGTVVRFSPSGTNLGTFISTGPNFAAGLAFDSAGDLYVANFEDTPIQPNGTISEFSSSGQFLGNVATGLFFPEFLAFQPSNSQPIGIPEPESLVLLVMGLTGGFLVSRRHRKQAGSRGGGEEGRRSIRA
jgi:sugar lactone lactonase YvrE